MRLFALTALTMIAFGANSVLNRMAVGQGLIDPVSFALIRLAAGALMLALLILARRLRSGGAILAGARGRVTGVWSLLVYLFGFSLAYGALDAGTGALILFAMVQITMFAGALIAREPVPARRWIGAGLAFAGLIGLMAPGGGGDGPGAEGLVAAALMAAAGVGWGLYSLSARGVADPLAATGWNFILALPVAVLALVLAGALPALAGAGADPAGILLAVLSGAVTSALGYALWYAILPALGATRAAVAQLTAPVVAALGGVLLLGEPLTLRFVLASALVLGGVALASIAPRPRRQPA
ncbi:MAG: EamA family transporter [Alphaproteobacteria bacterium HGW-Alphaproteobacteria-6]|nr:MAG: EamA family transporter [Alphaproteobacteria bacterium HGW-Alphaproteobacteria-6]